MSTTKSGDGKKDNHPKQERPDKEELGPTPIEEYRPIQAPINKGNLSEREFQDTLKTRYRATYDPEHASKSMELVEKYKTELEQVRENRAKADLHYAQGIRSALPHMDYESIKDLQDREDQERRNKYNQMDKENYAKGESLTKSFRGAAEEKTPLPEQFNKAREDLDRDR